MASKKTKLWPLVAEPPELLLESEVRERVRLSHATIWRLRKAGLFPEPRRISHKRVVYRRADIDAVVDGTWSRQPGAGVTR